MTDDQGAGDASFLGHPLVQTPELDAIAAESKHVKYFFTESICSRTRMCLFTGRNAISGGFPHNQSVANNSQSIQKNQYTLWEHLQKNGYTTILVGKHHVDTDTDLNAQMGFQMGNKLGVIPEFHAFATVDTAISYITYAKATYPSKPIAIFIAINEPHLPVAGVQQDWLADGRDSMITKFSYDTITVLPTIHLGNHTKIANYPVADIKYHYATLSQMSSGIGKFWEFYKAQSWYSNSVAFITSDNGGTDSPTVYAWNGEYSAAKGETYLGGTATYLLVHAPYFGWTTGEVLDQSFMQVADLMPTILHITGTYSNYPYPSRFVGENMLPYLQGSSTTRTTPYYQFTYYSDRRKPYSVGSINDVYPDANDWKSQLCYIKDDYMLIGKSVGLPDFYATDIAQVEQEGSVWAWIKNTGFSEYQCYNWRTDKAQKTDIKSTYSNFEALKQEGLKWHSRQSNKFKYSNDNTAVNGTKY